MPRKEILVPTAKAVGPYSQAVESNGFVFLSGQTPLDPATGALVQGGIEAQTRQVFANLLAVLKAAGLGFDDVQKVNIFLTDMNDFKAMNEIYKEQFTAPYPARSTIAVAALPINAQIEIEMIARKK